MNGLFLKERLLGETVNFITYFYLSINNLYMYLYIYK